MINAIKLTVPETHVQCGQGTTCEAGEHPGALVWYESSFDDALDVAPGDMLLLEMDQAAGEVSFVFCTTRAGVRDLHNGVRVRAVDGKDGRDNRYSMYIEVLLELQPEAAGAFKRLAAKRDA